MKKLALASCVFALAACQTSQEAVKTTTPTTFSGQVAAILADTSLPAVAVIHSNSGNIINHTAQGVRDRNQSTQVTEQDLWHIGSITKSFTATLVARLVEHHHLNWDDKIKDLVDFDIAPKYQDVTLEQLLNMRAGIVSNDYDTDDIDLDWPDAVTAQRALVSEIALNIDGDASVGEMTYSNISYVVAAHIAERKMADSYRNLLAQWVMQPLALNHYGFGAPTGDQPKGHLYEPSQGWMVFAADDDNADNPDWLTPAGLLHMSTKDMNAYLTAHLQGHLGTGFSDFLSQQSWQKLHLPTAENEYALGWVQDETTYVHDGSNGRWLALAGFDTDTKDSFFMVTNGVNLVNQDNNDLFMGIFALLDEQ